MLCQFQVYSKVIQVYMFFFFLAALGFYCCESFSLVCRGQGLLSGYGVWASDCRGFSCCWAQALELIGVISCSSRASGHRLNYCGPWAWFPQGLWNLPRPGIEPVSPAGGTGRFFTTGPLGKSYTYIFFFRFFSPTGYYRILNKFPQRCLILYQCFGCNGRCKSKLLKKRSGLFFFFA